MTSGADRTIECSKERGPVVLPSTVVAVVERVTRAVRGLDLQVSLVGGVVRDLLRCGPEVAVRDIDLVAVGDWSAVRCFSQRMSAELEVEPADLTRFGTATLQLDPDTVVDIAMARVERYPVPGALPEVRPGALIDDLRRRDFTINAMAIRVDGDDAGPLEDPVCGLADLREGVIRVLHPRSFRDDPTRIIRAVEFECRFGFSMAPETEAQARAALKEQVLDRISSERRRAVMSRLLSLPDAHAAVHRLQALGGLEQLGLEPFPGTQQRALLRSREAWETCRTSASNVPFASPVPELWWVRWLILAAGGGADRLERAAAGMAVKGAALRAARRAERVLGFLESKASARAALSPSQWVRLLEPAGLEGWLLAWAFARPEQEAGLEAFLERYRHVRSPLTGRDLVALGLSPGAAFSEILGTLRDLALDRELSRDEAIEWVLARQRGGGN